MKRAFRGLIIAAFVLAAFAPAARSHGSRLVDLADLSTGTHVNTMLQDNLLTIRADWSNVATPLSRRYDMGMGYDPAARRILIFGGRDETDVVSGETWENTPGSGWTQIFPATAPAPRYGHEIAFIGDTFLLFGGFDADGNVLSDTWLYDPAASSWTFVVTASSPEARGFFSLAASSHSNKAVLFGGVGANGLNVTNFTWIFNVAGSSWSMVNPSPRPSARRGAAITYDPVRQKIFLFGGRGNTWNSADLYNDTWSYDPASNVWEDRNPSTSPDAVEKGQILYDARHDQIVLFGGRETQTTYQENIYFYDDAAGRWLELIVPTTPSGREGHKTAYDAAAASGFSFGGRRGTTSSLLWSYQIYSSATWISDPVEIAGVTPIDWFDFSVVFDDPFLGSAPAPGAKSRFQIASSTDGASWTDFLGPDGSTSTAFIVQSTAVQNLASFHDNRRILKIKALLESDDFPARPKIESITFNFNQAPSAGAQKTPAAGAITNLSTPTFTWELSGDNDGLADTPLLYDLQIAGTTDFVSPAIHVTDIPKGASDVSYTISSDLATATWYWRVRAKDSHDLYGDWSAPFSILVDTITPPAPVTQMVAVMGSARAEIDLTWTFPGDDDGRLENGTYTVRFSSLSAIANESDWSGAAGERTGLFSADPGEAVAVTVTGLLDATTYYFAIKTEDELGNRSALSTVSPSAKTQSPPSPVEQIAAAKGPGATDVTLTWTFPGQDGNGLTNGTVRIRFTTSGPILDEADWAAAQGPRMELFTAEAGEDVASTVTGLSAATTYYFAVKTEDPFGQISAVSTVSPSLQTNGFPLAVTSLSGVKGPGNTAVTLSWTFPGDYEGNLSGGAVVVRARTAGPIANESDWNAASIEKIESLSAAVGDPIQTVVSGLSPATTYYFSVRVRDEYLALGPVSTLSPAVMTNAPPSVTLLYPTGGQNLSGVVPIQWSASDPNPGSVLSFELDLSVDSGANYQIVFATALPHGTTQYDWNVATLPPNTTYRIRVIAVDEFGLSDSDASSSNLSKSGSVPPPVVAFTSAPAMGELISGTVLIAWEVTAPNPLAFYSYRLDVSEDDGVTYTTVYTGTDPNHNWVSTHSANGQTFKLRATAFDSGSPAQSGSAVSNTFWVGNPLKPDDFQLLYPLEDDFPSAFDLVFRWVSSKDPDGGSLSYRVDYSTHADMSNAWTAMVAVQTNHKPALGSIPPDSRVYWRVTAITSVNMEKTTGIRYFDYVAKKAKTVDDFITVELLSALPADSYLTMIDARSTDADLLARGETDSKGDRLIKILSMPAWKIFIGDSSQSPVADSEPQFRITFHLSAVSGLQSQSDPAMDPANIRIARLNQIAPRWELIESQSQAQAAAADISATASGNGIFSIVAAPSPIGQLSGLTNFPNPFSPLEENTRIRYVLTEDSEVIVRIFNAFGDLVTEKSYPAGAAGGRGSSVGFTNEITWDGKNDKGAVVANGVYLAVITAEGASGEKQEIRRIGVLK